METTNHSPAISVVAEVEHIEKRTFLLDLKIQTEGAHRIVRVPRSTTIDIRELHRKLLDAGALLPSDQKQAALLLQEALATPAPAKLRITSRGGWHDMSFVCANETHGPQRGHLEFEHAVNLSNSRGLSVRKGRSATWTRALHPICEASSLVSFAIGCAFAAPLLRLANLSEGVIFNFHSPSTTGKTLAIRCAQSVFARAAPSDIPTYDISERALEELCNQRNDLLVALDEEGRSTGSQAERSRKARTKAYTIPSGTGRRRSETAAHVPNLEWSCIGLTSSEQPLTPADGRRREFGERLRHIDIPIPISQQNGIFDRVPPGTSASDLVRDAEATLREHYGSALRPYIEHLILNHEVLSAQLKRYIDSFLNKAEIKADGWERRFGTKFGLIYAAMKIAQQSGIAPWEKRRISERVLVLYSAARAAVFQPREEALIVSRTLASLIDDEHFPRIAKGSELPDNWAEVGLGFRRNSGSAVMIAVHPDHFSAIVGVSTRVDAVFDELEKLNVALPGSKGKRRKQVTINGGGLDGRARWFCFSEKALLELAKIPEA